MKTKNECVEYLRTLEKSASSAKGYAYIEMLRWVLDLPILNKNKKKIKKV